MDSRWHLAKKFGAVEKISVDQAALKEENDYFPARRRSAKKIKAYSRSTRVAAVGIVDAVRSKDLNKAAQRTRVAASLHAALSRTSANADGVDVSRSRDGLGSQSKEGEDTNVLHVDEWAMNV